MRQAARCRIGGEGKIIGRNIIPGEHAGRGRPRIVGITCPKCGRDSLICGSTRPQGSLLARYYRCRLCGHRGVLISGSDRNWWKDTEKPPRSPEGCS